MWWWWSSHAPSMQPSQRPTNFPSSHAPTMQPSQRPTNFPTSYPSSVPTSQISHQLITFIWVGIVFVAIMAVLFALRVLYSICCRSRCTFYGVKAQNSVEIQDIEAGSSLRRGNQIRPANHIIATLVHPTRYDVDFQGFQRGDRIILPVVSSPKLPTLVTVNSFPQRENPMPPVKAPPDNPILYPEYKSYQNTSLPIPNIGNHHHQTDKSSLNIIYTDHAMERMEERHIDEIEIENVLSSPEKNILTADNWKQKVNFNGITVVNTIDPDETVRVITAWREWIIFRNGRNTEIFFTDRALKSMKNLRVGEEGVLKVLCGNNRIDRPAKEGAISSQLHSLEVIYKEESSKIVVITVHYFTLSLILLKFMRKHNNKLYVA